MQLTEPPIMVIEYGEIRVVYIMCPFCPNMLDINFVTYFDNHQRAKVDMQNFKFDHLGLFRWRQEKGKINNCCGTFVPPQCLFDQRFDQGMFRKYTQYLQLNHRFIFNDTVNEPQPGVYRLYIFIDYVTSLNTLETHRSLHEPIKLRC